jgi:hypothetical protein
MGNLRGFMDRQEDFSKVKEIRRLQGGIQWHAPQTIPPIDAEIGTENRCG